MERGCLILRYFCNNADVTQNGFSLTALSRKGKRGIYANKNDKQLYSAARKFYKFYKMLVVYAIGACSQCNIFVLRQCIRDATNNGDPVSRGLRRSICRMRWVHSVPAPNALHGKCAQCL